MCVAHGWTFDLPSGCRLIGGEPSDPMSVATVPVRVEGDIVVVSVEPPRPDDGPAMPD
jgi:nitrite reductase/ring-hydroxylating ferredoxin subunit